MKEYTDFAYVYDELMDNVPYDEWSEYLIELLKEYGVDGGIVVDLGCGTGKITRRLFNAGYDMIGIDMSEDMLDVARYNDEFGDEFSDEYDCEYDDESSDSEDNSDDEESFDCEECSDDKMPRSILYLCQDMREFELYGTVDAIVSICDSMNYITELSDLKKVFELANNYLEPDGVFIFDMNTEYKYENILKDSVIAENRDDCSLIWENYYDKKTKINQYDITIYCRADEDGETDEEGCGESEKLFRRIEETHLQRAYGIEEVKKTAEDAGMEFVAVYDAFTHDAPKADSERVYFVFREKYKEGKYYDK